MRKPWGLLSALVLGVLAIALLLGTAASALAQPDPTLGLAALQAKLDGSSSGIPGYFKTVDKGSTIETIPVTIMSITGGPTSSDALIVFEATGSQIDKFGGIVAGMSGSPIYVDDGGTDKIVGAVSYGDYFTKGGTGLATPIESMQLVQSVYQPESIQLAKPLITTDGLVKSIVITAHPQDYSLEAKQGAFVARPLSSVFIGGLNPRSLGYKALAKILANRGQSVVALSSGLGASPEVGDQSFETTLLPGAAVAAMESRGDMWVGGVGTVTNADTDTVLAFGHSALWGGASSLYMTNAWIDGVWPSTYEPYKLARPEMLRGTITQDRNAGILGVINQFPDETTITAHALDLDSGRSATSTVYMPRQMINAGTIDPITAAFGAYVAGEQLMDAQSVPGSALVTTTVLATDGTHTYTATMVDHIDDGYDVTLAAMQDAATAISSLQQVPTDGVQSMNLLSVDVKAAYTARRDWAKIVGIDLPKGLKVGANPVKVSALVYGLPATQTIDATITVPKGTSLSGVVVAESQSTAMQNSNMGYYESISVSNGDFGQGGITISVPNGPSRVTLADAINGLNAQLPNNVMTLAYVPNSDSFGSSYYGPDEIPAITSASIVTTVPSSWAFTSATAASVTRISVAASPGIVSFGGGSLLRGTLVGPSLGATVAVYATPAGGAEQYVGTVPTVFNDELDNGNGGLSFKAPVGGLLTTTSFRLHYAGASGYTSADAVVVVAVRPQIKLVSSAASVKSGRAVTLTATLRPSTTGGGRVVFEYSSGRHWRTIGTKTLTALVSSATASMPWKVAKGKHNVRVRYLGGATNVASTSGNITVTGK